MSSLFGILEMGKRMLSAQQMATNIVGNNIANVNTPGYSRQAAELQPSHSIESPWGPIGTGVEIDSIRRYRDSFLDDQMRENNGTLGRWQSLEVSLSEIEAFLNETAESGLGAVLDGFWNSWQDLANDPENKTSRTLVKEKANSLTDTFHQLATSLTNKCKSLDEKVVSTVQEINSILTEIADLNRQLPAFTYEGSQANQLLDKQDLLLDNLSELIDIRVLRKGNGSVSVFIGTGLFVDGGEGRFLTIQRVTGGEIAVSSVRDETGSQVEISGGKLNGLIEVRDERIPAYLTDLDEIAKALVQAVNSSHSAGYGLDGTTGNDFFDSNKLSAAEITLDSAITRNVLKIAASSDVSTGNNTIALAIAGLKSSQLLNGGTTTLNHAYANLVGSIGLDAQKASNNLENYQLLSEHIETQRQSVHGVALDEEMVNLIKYQHAYEAAARVVTVVDEMITSIIEMI